MVARAPHIIILCIRYTRTIMCDVCLPSNQIGSSETKLSLCNDETRQNERKLEKHIMIAARPLM